MRFIEISIGGAPSQRRGLRRIPFIPALGFGARIRQSPSFVTRLSCFLSALGRLYWPTNPVAGPASGPPTGPDARPRPWHDRRKRGFPGSAGPRTPAGGYIGGIPV